MAVSLSPYLCGFRDAATLGPSQSTIDQEVNLKRHLVPLTKSPLPHKGRIGKKEWQDWYKTLVVSARLAKDDPSAMVHVISAVHITGQPTEVQLYDSTLLRLGVPSKRINLINEGQETIGQIQAVEKHISADGEGVTFIVTPTHYLRVLWLTRHMKKAKVVIAWGLPRLKEAVTDFVFTFLFPIIECHGYKLARITSIPWMRSKKAFQDHAIKTREGGKQF